MKSIPDSSKDELITYFIKAFRKISEVSKNKKTSLPSKPGVPPQSEGQTICTTSKSTPPPPTGTCKVCKKTGPTPGGAKTGECAEITANMSQNCSSVSSIEGAITAITTNCTKITPIFRYKVCGF